jgi:hypothetical protein
MWLSCWTRHYNCLSNNTLIKTYLLIKTLWLDRLTIRCDLLVEQNDMFVVQFIGTYLLNKIICLLKNSLWLTCWTRRYEMFVEKNWLRLTCWTRRYRVSRPCLVVTVEHWCHRSRLRPTVTDNLARPENWVFYKKLKILFCSS